MRTRTSFQKRQKEIARVEKQREKAAKRIQKKLEGKQPPPSDEDLLAEARELRLDALGAATETHSEHD